MYTHTYNKNNKKKHELILSYIMAFNEYNIKNHVNFITNLISLAV